MTLSSLLAAKKTKFFEDVKKDGAKDWTIVMGNEAGDLDSIASSIGYSFLSPKNSTIALIQTPRPDLYLRPENLHAFQEAKLTSSHDELLCIDDLPVPIADLASSYALVDHNKLLPIWSNRTAPVQVVGVIDHHEDEHAHLEASPREIVVPLGSCASLVAKTFAVAWDQDLTAAPDTGEHPPPPPQELATLLLSAIYIDTAGLKTHGKAQEIDYHSAAFLESTVTNPDLASASASSSREEVFEILSEKKFAVEHLSTRDLLRRDYKQYTFAATTLPSTNGSAVPIEVGLSTVPLGLKAWLRKDEAGFRTALEAWAVERKLDVAGILTTFNTEKKDKHRRQLLILVGAGGSSADSAEHAKELTDVLVDGLEGTDILNLETIKMKDEFAAVKGVEGAEVKGTPKVWKQGNAHATRKIVAPVVRAILEGKNAAAASAPAEE